MKKDGIKNKIFSTLILLIGIISVVSAQQEPMYTQYMHNAITVNPGYAGSREMLSIGLLHRTQWSGIDGAPTTQTFFLHSPLARTNMGAGLTVTNDKIGPSNQTWINGDISYSIKIGEKSKLSFGLKGGFTRNKVILSNLTTASEVGDAAQVDLTGSIQPNIGFGMYYSSRKWYLGAAIPRMTKNKLTTEKSIEEPHYYLIAGYIFDLGSNLKLKTSALSKMVEGSPFSFDLSANFLINDKIWLGAAYRHQESVSFLLGYQFTDQLLLGYSYDYSLGEIGSINSGSHEIMLTYDLNISKNKVISPRFF